jgi:hypothetical protein
MNRKQILKFIKHSVPDNLEILLADGFDEAFCGIGYQFNKVFAIYDTSKCIDILSQDMSPEEAIEYFSHNVVGAYIGENTPIFLDKFYDISYHKICSKLKN